MTVVTGTILSITDTEGIRIAMVDVRGTRLRIPLTLLPDVVIGESILIESGVATARVRDDENKEQPNVSGYTR